MSKKKIKKKSSQNRRKIHCVILIFGAVLLVCNEYAFSFINQIAYDAIDKKKHFEMGRLIATISFLMAFSGIVCRIFLVNKKNYAKSILWLPFFIFLAIILAMLITFVIAIGKEAVDSTGLGNVEWADVTATIEGAASMSYAIAILMALTPFLIPADLIFQIPTILKSDFQTGHQKLDQYVEATKKQPKLRGNAQVLLVEDDIVCSTNVLDFCALMKLTCHHIDTIKEAEKYVDLQAQTLRVIILDIFVRIEDHNDRRTGLDWLKELNEKYPKESRYFKIVIISGHSHMAEDCKEKADLIMQKPWDPLELRAKFQEWALVK